MKFILRQFGQILSETVLEEGREYFIGRSEECEFVISPKQGISRKHIRIHFLVEEGHWKVSLVSSSGGLFLDQEEVESAVIDKSLSLGFDNYVLEFVKEEEEEEIEFIEEEEEEGDKTQVQEDIPQDHSVILSSDEHTQSTQILAQGQLIHSLHISIEGEFSDYVTLKGVDQWLIGRSEECDISIDYSILTRKHMEIFRTGNEFYIKDLGSVNKTKLNGQELSPNQPIQLRANDEISVLDLCIIFEVRDKKYEHKMSTLPATSNDEAEYMPEFAAPKVILEEDDGSSEKEKKQAGNAFRTLIVRTVLFFSITAGVVAYFYQDEKKKKAEALAIALKAKEEKKQADKA